MTVVHREALAGIAPSFTGIPPLEAQMLRSRGERHRDDQARTTPSFRYHRKTEWSHERRIQNHRHRRTDAAA